MTDVGTYHHGDLRNALLAEAAKMLEVDGADALSLRALARTVGVSHAAPTHHFANRRGLLAQLAAEGFEALADAMHDAMADADKEHWLSAIGEVYVRYAVENPQRYRLMFASEILSGDCPEDLTLQSSRAYLALLQAVRQEEPTVGPAEYEMAAPELGAWSIVHGSAMLWLDGQLASLTKEQFLQLASTVLSAAS